MLTSELRKVDYRQGRESDEIRKRVSLVIPIIQDAINDTYFNKRNERAAADKLNKKGIEVVINAYIRVDRYAPRRLTKEGKEAARGLLKRLADLRDYLRNNKDLAPELRFPGEIEELAWRGDANQWLEG